MYLPIAILEGKKIQRIVFSVKASSEVLQHLYPLMEKVYEMGGWCFDLPTYKHLESFKLLRESTGDNNLIGFGHIEAEVGVSLTGKPLHRFESKVISTMMRNVIPPDLVRKLFPAHPREDVLTQREIDRIAFDQSRFHQALSIFDPEEIPFLLIGGQYGDWLWGLGRGDLLKEMVSEARKKGFIPIFSGQWATFVLPKSKHLGAAAYAIPVNKRKALFDLNQAWDLIKKFDQPVLSLDPLAGGKLLRDPERAFSFLLNELKVYSVFAEVTFEKEIQPLFQAMGKIPSLIPFRKT